MGHRLSIAITLISLVVLVATAAIWIRSWALNGYTLSSASGYGGSDYFEWTTRAGNRWHVRANPDGITTFQFMGRASFRVPYWLVMLPASIFPTRWLIRRMRTRRRLREGQCLICGYDLRGSVSDRCSECGALAAKRPAG
jgi:hypothetical protein